MLYYLGIEKVCDTMAESGKMSFEIGITNKNTK